MQKLSLTNKYLPYPEYKDFGVEWLGQVPASWQVQKVVSVFDFSNEKGFEDDFEALSVTYGGIKKQLENAAKVAEGSVRKRVRIGDIVINSRSDRKGAVGESLYNGVVSLVYGVLRPRSDEVVSKYYHYLFRSKSFSEEFYRWGRGIVDDLWTTRANEMKAILISVPSKAEQEKIAAYLDEQTARIDETIAKKKCLIELLKEKRTATINQAVTKGLDPKAELVESSIEWIGKISKNWKIEKLKYLSSLVTAKTSIECAVSNYVALENAEGKTGRYLPPTDAMNPDSIVTSFAEHDVLFSKLRPYLAKVLTPCFDGYATGEFLVLRPKKKVLKGYLKYRLLSQDFITIVNDSTYGAQMPRASWNFIGSQFITLPPIEEQEKITQYLDEVIEKYQHVIDRVQKTITSLQELKSSLISHAVTGKIKV